MGALRLSSSMSSRRNERDAADLASSKDEPVSSGARRSASTQPPRSTQRLSQPASDRRERMRQRTSTLKIRPWSQLPGVVAYIVLDADEQITDAWGSPATEGLARAAAFRQRVRAGRFDGTHALEICVEARRLLSVSRPDGWFVHVWIEGNTDEIAGILSIVGG